MKPRINTKPSPQPQNSSSVFRKWFLIFKAEKYSSICILSSNTVLSLLASNSLTLLPTQAKTLGFYDEQADSTAPSVLDLVIAISPLLLVSGCTYKTRRRKYGRVQARGRVACVKSRAWFESGRRCLLLHSWRIGRSA
jgi:hypothetical protein